VEYAEKDCGCDTVVALLPTSPLRMPYDIDMAIRLHRKVDNPEAMVSGATKSHEMLLYKFAGEYGGECIIGDKAYRYGMAAGGFSCCTSKQYKRAIQPVSVYDSEVNNNMRGNENKIKEEPYYYIMEWWQQFEVDTWEHVPVVDFYMRRNVLTEPDIYERYAECDILTKYDRRESNDKTTKH
jgi:hypothetical protein